MSKRVNSRRKGSCRRPRPANFSKINALTIAKSIKKPEEILPPFLQCCARCVVTPILVVHVDAIHARVVNTDNLWFFLCVIRHNSLHSASRVSLLDCMYFSFRLNISAQHWDNTFVSPQSCHFGEFESHRQPILSASNQLEGRVGEGEQCRKRSCFVHGAISLNPQTWRSCQRKNDGLHLNKAHWESRQHSIPSLYE